MATDIDSLQIQINATATKANNSIDKLVGKLDRLSNSLQGLQTGNLSNLSRGVQQLGTAMQSMNAVKTADFTRLAKNLNTLSGVDSAKINSLATSIEQIGRSFSGLSGISNGATQMADLAKAISQLGYKSATQAITNIPQLATAMKQLMQELSKAPKVSQNLIDMTNALAKLARTGASSGRAAQSLGNTFNNLGNNTRNLKSSFNGISGSLQKCGISFKNFSRQILASFGIYFGIYGIIRGIKEAINISSDLTEVQNVVDATFGDMSYKVEDFAKKSIEQFGMSELALKQYSSRFQAMGTNMGVSNSAIQKANEFLNKQTNGYVELSDSMSDVSLALTKLTADMASFYNVDQKAVAEDLESIFTGQSRPLRTYGLDLTQATLKEWALKNGLDANISSMSQAEKTMLRYQYVLANTGVAQGDFARTQDTWANQTRILIENLKSLGGTVGTALINVFKPLVSWLNSVMSTVISVVKTIVDAIGAIFGWTLEVSPKGSTYDDTSSGLDDIASSADGAGNSMGGAADKANELKKALMGFDEINKLPDETSSSGGSGGSGGGSGTGTGGGVNTELVRTEGALDTYKSEIKNLEQLGAYIGDALSKAMESINWQSIYKKARGFGTGLADFLNGLISPRLFGNLGKTIASSINTALEFLNSFGTTFNWSNFGESIATGLSKFFATFDFNLLQKTLKTWANGLARTIQGFVNGIEIDGVDLTDLKDSFNSLYEALKPFSKNLGKGLNWLYVNAIKPLAKWALEDGIPAAIDFISTAISGLDEIIDAAKPVLGWLWNSFLKPLSKWTADAIVVTLEALTTAFSNLASGIAAVLDIFTKFANQFGRSDENSRFDEGIIWNKVLGGEITFTTDGKFIDKATGKEWIRDSDGFYHLDGMMDVENISDNTSDKEKTIKDGTMSVDNTVDNVPKSEKTVNGFEANVSEIKLGNKVKIPKDEIQNALAEGTIIEVNAELGIYKNNITGDFLAKDSYGNLKTATNIKTEADIEKINTPTGVSTSVDVTANEKPAEKIINKFTKETSKKEIPVKTTVKTTRKQFSNEVEKVIGKIKTYVETGISTKKDDFEKEARDKYSKATVSISAKIGTSPLTLRYGINNMFSDYVQKIKGKVDITELNDSLSKSKKTFDGTMNFTDVIKKNLSSNQKTINSTANFTDAIKKNLPSDKKTINSTANFTDTVKKHLTSDKKTLNTIAKYTKSTDALPSSAKTFISTAKLTNTQDAIPSYKRVIGGVTAIVSSLSKVAGLSFSLKAAFSFLTNGLKLIFNKNGGVFNGGSWKPITAYAGGGSPDMGQLFVAREAGPELVGTLGGHTAVMNNDQIVSSVSAGVYQAVSAAISQYSSQLSRNGATPNINVYVGGRQVTDVVVEEVNKRTKTTGMCPIMT